MSTEVKVRSEEHTSELQSQSNLVCRLLLEKKNNSLRIDLIAVPPWTHGDQLIHDLPNAEPHRNDLRLYTPVLARSCQLSQVGALLPGVAAVNASYLARAREAV